MILLGCAIVCGYGRVRYVGSHWSIKGNQSSPSHVQVPVPLRFPSKGRATRRPALGGAQAAPFRTMPGHATRAKRLGQRAGGAQPKHAPIRGRGGAPESILMAPPWSAKDTLSAKPASSSSSSSSSPLRPIAMMMNLAMSNRRKSICSVASADMAFGARTGRRAWRYGRYAERPVSPQWRQGHEEPRRTTKRREGAKAWERQSPDWHRMPLADPFAMPKKAPNAAVILGRSSLPTFHPPCHRNWYRYRNRHRNRHGYRLRRPRPVP